jgi:hypothetical protein
MGPNPTTAVSHEDFDAGVIPRAMTAIFDLLNQKKQLNSDAEVDHQVCVQFIELYGEEIRDLLVSTATQRSHEKLTIRDFGTDEPEVVGATQQRVSSASEALDCLAHGMLRRVTGATAMNESSSRSHAILSVCIEQSILFKRKVNHEHSSNSVEEEHLQVIRSKFNFVDLAGAERQKRTGASGKRLKEGIDINKGLSNLGNVISALGDPKKRGRTHVPYRDAKLTRLLKGSLGGNHKSLMIACVSPAVVNMGETLNCLRYANRAKNIQNKPVANLDASSRLVQDLQAQVKVLASELLKALDGKVDEIQYSRDSLITLSNDGSIGPVITSPNKTTDNVAKSSRVELLLKETTAELSKTQRLLREARTCHDDAEFELHTVRAQNGLLDAKFSLLMQDGCETLTQSDDIEQAFMKKAVEYEAEISKLKRALLEAENVMDCNTSWNVDVVCGRLDYLYQNEPSIDEEERLLKDSRDRLTRISDAISNEGPLGNEITIDTAPSSIQNGDYLEEVDNSQQAKIDEFASRYLTQEYNDDEENLQKSTNSNVSEELRIKQFASDIQELSRSIETKERLIVQIKRNKEREMVRFACKIVSHHIFFSWNTLHLLPR